jgi:hypothetical protein
MLVSLFRVNEGEHAPGRHHEQKLNDEVVHGHVKSRPKRILRPRVSK